MRELKFKDGDVIGNLKIIKKDKVRETKAWWKTKEKLRKNEHFYANSVFHKIDFGFWCNSRTNEQHEIFTECLY